MASGLLVDTALLLVPAVASSTRGTCSAPNMGDSLDGFGYQRCPLPPAKAVLPRTISPCLLFPSSTTS